MSVGNIYLALLVVESRHSLQLLIDARLSALCIAQRASPQSAMLGRVVER